MVPVSHTPNHMDDDPNNGALDNPAADHEGPVWAEADISNIRKSLVQESARNNEVIYNFLNGNFSEKIHSKNLRMKHIHTGWALENYYVTIGFISDSHPDIIFINNRHYSVNASRIQNLLRKMAIEGEHTYFEVDDTEINEVMVLGHTT